MTNNKQDYVANLSELVGTKITGAAYSELGGFPTLILNLLHSDGRLTSHYTPLDIKSLYDSEVKQEEEK